jgi:hypothetical protein
VPCIAPPVEGTPLTPLALRSRSNKFIKRTPNRPRVASSFPITDRQIWGALPHCEKPKEKPFIFFFYTLCFGSAAARSCRPPTRRWFRSPQRVAHSNSVLNTVVPSSGFTEHTSAGRSQQAGTFFLFMSFHFIVLPNNAIKNGSGYATHSKQKGGGMFFAQTESLDVRYEKSSVT